MTAYLMTRGTPRRLDYRFLGDGPPQRWWAPLDDLVVLEQPAIIVRGVPDGPRVLVSGIPSARKDVIGTPIRFMVVVDNPRPALLSRLVTAGLDREARAALGAELDAAFPSELVDAALAGDQAMVEKLDDRLAAILDADPEAVAAAPAEAAIDEASGRSWVGSTGREPAQAAFRQRSALLGGGRPGWAFTTGALSSLDGVRHAVASLGDPAAVLLDEGGPIDVVDLGGGPGKDPAVPPDGPPPRSTLRKLLVAVLALLAIGAAVAGVLARRPPSARNANPVATISAGPTPTATAGPAPAPAPASPSISSSTTPTAASGQERSKSAHP